MRLGIFTLLLLAACSGGGSGESGPDGGNGTPPGQPDGGGGDDGEPASCGPATCDGCCDGDTCRQGDSDDQCGAGGAVCQACGRWGECGPADVCELANDTRWNVVVESGTASAVNPGGTDWDGDGDLPDIYVLATAWEGNSEMRERTDAHEDLTPTWNQTVLSDVPGSALEGMNIELLDSDGNDDDTFGRCISAVSLEDVEAGRIELTCPRGLDPEAKRAGWTVHLRLEPRSGGRPDAPAFDRRAAAPRTSEPGACSITWDGGNEAVSVATYDSWGRLLSNAWHHDSGEVSVDHEWVCSGDHCDEPGEAWSLRRTEPGPFGMRVRVDHHNDVHLYDSIGRLVAMHSYSLSGHRASERLVRYAAKRRVEYYRWLDDSPSDEERATTEFDEHGSPVFIVDGGVTHEVEVDGNGLPIHVEVVKSDNPEVPIGDAYDYAYQGACAEVLAYGITNGLVSR